MLPYPLLLPEYSAGVSVCFAVNPYLYMLNLGTDWLLLRVNVLYITKKQILIVNRIYKRKKILERSIPIDFSIQYHIYILRYSRACMKEEIPNILWKICNICITLIWGWRARQKWGLDEKSTWEVRRNSLGTYLSLKFICRTQSLGTFI